MSVQRCFVLGLSLVDLKGDFAMGVLDFVDDFTRLNSELSEWSQKTFGSDDERGPIGALKHLAKEAKEAAEAADRFPRTYELFQAEMDRSSK